MSPRPRSRKIKGETLDAHRMRVLAELAKHPDGSAAINLVMPGGCLAALVKMGLAEVVGHDRLGEPVYRANEKGLQVRNEQGGRP